MIRIKNAVYPVVAAAALVLMAWQPIDAAPAHKTGGVVEGSVSSDFGSWSPTLAPVVAPSASSKV